MEMVAIFKQGTLLRRRSWVSLCFVFFFGGCMMAAIMGVLRGFLEVCLIFMFYMLAILGFLAPLNLLGWLIKPFLINTEDLSEISVISVIATLLLVPLLPVAMLLGVFIALFIEGCFKVLMNKLNPVDYPLPD